MTQVILTVLVCATIFGLAQCNHDAVIAKREAFAPRIPGEQFMQGYQKPEGYEDAIFEAVSFNRMAKEKGIRELNIFDIHGMTARDIARLRVAVMYKVDAHSLDGRIVKKMIPTGKACITKEVEE
jgi:hypothetical protein